jgi:hypothetical protein
VAAQGAHLFANEGQTFKQNDRGEQAKDHALGQAAVADADTDTAKDQSINDKHYAQAKGAAENGKSMKAASEEGGAGGVVREKRKRFATIGADLREIGRDEPTRACGR